MRLLLDQNLSARPLVSLEAKFPGSTHVRELGLESGDDQQVSEYAGAAGLIIVSKDTDFYQRSVLFGHPPIVIWVALGNWTTAAVRDLLESAVDSIEEFNSDEELSFLVLPSS